MALSGDLRFSPILHNITPERVVFCYRANDPASLDVAQHYCTVRGVPAANLISLPCSTDNIISENEYISTIEDPIRAALASLGNEFTSGGQKEIWVIVLGHRVPHAYRTTEDPYLDSFIAVASALHRVGFVREFKSPNHTFNRVNFKFFDATDAAELYITAVLDGPDAQTVKKMIDRSLDVDNQVFVTGKIYIDPYGNKDTSDQLDYEQDLIEFRELEIPNLGLDFVSTVDATIPDQDPYIDPIGFPYIDPTVAALDNDSFYWGWFVPEFSHSLFLDQNERRVFLYNADDDGADNLAEDIDESGANPWVNLAINVEPGYAATAGAVSAPGEDAYLRPRPFFNTLHQGATIGEAFLFASRFVSWKTVLIGDPLMVVNFPVELPTEQDINTTTIPQDESIILVQGSIEEALAWGMRQSRLTQDLLDKVVSSANLSEEIELLYSLNKWRTLKNDTVQFNTFSRAAESWVSFIIKTTSLTVNQWLTLRGEKISFFFSELLKTTTASAIDSSLIHPEGEWSFTFTYTHPEQTLENVNFRLHLSRTRDFKVLEKELFSEDSISGWKYESEPYIFVQMPPNGFPSNFSGRRVRFVSPANHRLRRTEAFYVRWRAFGEDGNAIGDFVVDPNLLLIAR